MHNQFNSLVNNKNIKKFIYILFQDPLYAVINKNVKPTHITPETPPVNNPQLSLMPNPMGMGLGVPVATPLGSPPKPAQPMGMMGQTLLPPTGMLLQPIQPMAPHGGDSLL